ncbi:MAG: hypothetical protein J7K23_01660 [Thermoproteales archaeon]|nr:hypothetical protein [Thermoproteales archaeon]
MTTLIPENVIGTLYTILYLVLLGIIISIIYGISEWFSRDRVLKLFERKRAFVFIEKEVYYGKILVPSRSGGCFEIFFPSEYLENPFSLLAFLIENYHETGQKKFLIQAQRILEEFKRIGIVDKDFSLDNIKIDPWAPPSLVSRKIYKDELGKLQAIMMFREFLSRKEKLKRWQELKSLYSPSLTKVISRKTYNALTYVKDKIASSLTRTTTTFLGGITTPDIQKSLEDVQKKAIGSIGSTYDALLENSIGRLVTVRVQDVEGEVKYYQGVLREYSNQYILVYDIDYRIQMITKFKGEEELTGFPQTFVKFHGFPLTFNNHIKSEIIEKNNDGLKIRFLNISKDPLKIENIKYGDKTVNISKVLFPKESLEVFVNGLNESTIYQVNYEISKEADIIWPRRIARVVGLGDYPPYLLSEILTLRKIRI